MRSFFRLLLQGGLLLAAALAAGVAQKYLDPKAPAWFLQAPTEADLNDGEMTAQKAMKWVRDETVLWIDARQPAQFADGHLQGAINFPPQSMEIPNEVMNLLPHQGKAIFIYCDGASCSASHDVAQFLDRSGFSSLAPINVVVDGWQALKKLGAPVE